ncbi:pyruvate kinase [Planctomycetota bacterium]
MANKTEFLLTKIIATLGPATASPHMIKELIKEGVRAFRINFSHGTFDEHEKTFRLVRQVSDQMGIPVGVLGDLCGPKIRLGEVVEGGVHVHTGKTVVFQREPIHTQPPAHDDDPVVFSTTYPAFIDEVAEGERILLDDGFVRLLCLDTAADRVTCRVLDGGRLTSHKGVNLPDTNLSVPALTEKDVACVEFAVKLGFDFLALSFVRTGADVRQLKEHLVRLGARPQEDALNVEDPLAFNAIEFESEDIIPIISKIEKPQAIENLVDILRETDAVMVARGDLGVEMDVAEVAVLQKQIISKCQEYGIPTIVATQMLQSMIDAPTPTRAEVSDVANAIFDGADAVMLSGETAIGKHPVQAVEMMNRIAQKSNAYILKQAWEAPLANKAPKHKQRAVALAHGVRTMVRDLEIKLLIVWSELGGGAVYLSEQHIPRPILACSSSMAMLRRMALLYGLTPVRMLQPANLHEFLQTLDKQLMNQTWITPGDAVAVVTGEPICKVGITNQVCIHYVGESLTPEQHRAISNRKDKTDETF